MNIYAELTKQFNHGRLRAVLAGGQAVVLYRLAMMSKDGDWILREDEESLAYVLDVLEKYGARYRFGAPLDVRWMIGGWSTHLEFQWEGLRVRTDFFTRPPRLPASVRAGLWNDEIAEPIPKVGLVLLAELKKTNREKDYAVIGELARLMTDIDEQILYSRSARDLLDLAEQAPERMRALISKRPLLDNVAQGREALEVALDAERRQLMRTNETRLQRYMEAGAAWADCWPEVVREIQALPLKQAHAICCARAEGVLPYTLEQA